MRKLSLLAIFFFALLNAQTNTGGGVNIPSGGVTAKTCPAGQAMTAVTSGGVFTCAAAGTGDVVGPAGATSGDLASFNTATGKLIQDSGIPSAAVMVNTGANTVTAVAAPGTPAAGKGAVYIDSTSKNIAVKDDAGTIKHGIQDVSCGAGTFVSAVSAAGAGTCGTPAAGTAGIQSGAYSAAPACAAGTSGVTYITTDSGLVGFCNGTAWIWKYGPVIAVPTSTSVSNNWINQGGATVTNNASGTGVNFIGNNTGVNSWVLRVQTVPATPYTYKVCFTATTESGGFGGLSLGWTDGLNAATSKLALLSLYTRNTAVSIMGHQQWSNATTPGSSYTITPYEAWAVPYMCMALQDDGVTRKIAFSYDKQNWNTMNYAGEGHADFLTPTYIGYAVNSNNSGIPSMFVWSEEVVAATTF